MAQINIGQGQGITQAIASHLGMSKDDCKKVGLAQWQQVMSLVDQNNTQNKTNKEQSIFSGGNNVKNLGNSANWKTDFVVQQGTVEIQQSLWDKIVAILKPLAAAPSAPTQSEAPVEVPETPKAGQTAELDAFKGMEEKAREMTAFLNPTENSYKRFGSHKAPIYVAWSSENRSQLVRIPAAVGEYRRAELRSPDPTANPYLAFTLMIYAGLYGIENKSELPMVADFNIYKASAEVLAKFEKLPQDMRSACEIAANSNFIKNHIPASILDIYCNR